jgi:NADH-ubiquinone oxidoreductase chain 6
LDYNLLTVTIEFFTKGNYDFLLDFLYFIIILSSIFIIIIKNTIISAIFLIALFFFVSVYLIILGLSFLGLSYIIVYIGALSILFLFILMLINIKISEIKNDTMNSIPLFFVISILFIYPSIMFLPYFIYLMDNVYDYFHNFSEKLFFVIGNV